MHPNLWLVLSNDDLDVIRNFEDMAFIFAKTSVDNETLEFNPNHVGFVGDRFEVGQSKITPFLKLVIIMLEN